MKKLIMTLFVALMVISLFGCKETAVEKEDPISPELTFTVSDEKKSTDEPYMLDQCRNLCGDGYCNEYRCLEHGDAHYGDQDGVLYEEECNSVTRSCPETEENCAEDCA